MAEDHAVHPQALRVLEKQGHQATVAESGRVVLTALEKQNLDLVLRNAQVPEMDGLAKEAALEGFPPLPRSSATGDGSSSSNDPFRRSETTAVAALGACPPSLHFSPPCAGGSADNGDPP